MYQEISVKVVEGWITMATVPTNSQSVVMVEENTSVDATVTLIVPSKLSLQYYEVNGIMMRFE